MTREELREIAIFLTHYVGFPLGSKLDGAVKRVVAKRKKAEEKGAARDRRTTSTTPSRCTSAGTSMTSRYAALSRDAARHAGAGAAADRPADRPVRNGAGASSLRASRGDAADRDRGVGGASPHLHQADAEGAQLRGRRRRHDLQGPAARHRRPAAVHGLPLHRARPVARRVPPRPLRRAARCRADGRGLRPRHVPRHRGPDLRRHRASRPTARHRSGRSTGRRGCRPTGTRTARGR